MPMQQFRPTILNLLLSTALHLVLPPKQPNPWYFSCCTSQTSECTANVSQHNMFLQTDLFDNKCKDLPGTSGNKTLDFWFLSDALKQAILLQFLGIKIGFIQNANGIPEGSVFQFFRLNIEAWFGKQKLCRSWWCRMARSARIIYDLCVPFISLYISLWFVTCKLCGFSLVGVGLAFFSPVRSGFADVLRKPDRSHEPERRRRVPTEQWKANRRCSIALKATLAKHSCLTLFSDNRVGHSFVTLLWHTLCGALLRDTFTRHSCLTLLLDTLVAHSGKTLSLNTLKHSCKTLLLETLAWHIWNFALQSVHTGPHSTTLYCKICTE